MDKMNTYIKSISLEILVDTLLLIGGGEVDENLRFVRCRLLEEYENRLGGEACDHVGSFGCVKRRKKIQRELDPKLTKECEHLTDKCNFFGEAGERLREKYVDTKYQLDVLRKDNEEFNLANKDALYYGRLEIKRRERERTQSLRERLTKAVEEMILEVNEYLTQALIYDRPEWLNRAIRRYLGLPSVVQVKIEYGGPAKPKYEGECGHTTTPAGSPVYHPCAYRWPTVYHCDTRTVTVGYGWLRRHARRIAQGEAEKKVR